MDWRFQSEPLPRRAGSRFRLTSGAESVSFERVLLALRDDPAFREEFNAILANLPFAAFRWETPSLSDLTRTRPFEFVALDSPLLARRADSEAFVEHFRGRTEGVVAFPNLSGDAILIVPRPLKGDESFTHLADFVRHAPEEQRDEFWHLVAEESIRRLGNNPFWLSTAGAGVAWLHVRLDDRPKYYGFEEYRSSRSDSR